MSVAIGGIYHLSISLSLVLRATLLSLQLEVNMVSAFSARNTPQPPPSRAQGLDIHIYFEISFSS